MGSHNDLGRIGENLAVDHLTANGYDILERNYRFDRAEIDIIAEKDDQIIVVEVKTRNSDFFGDPQEFITKSKIKLLVKAANEYILQNNIEKEVRFDVIAVLKNKKEERLEHFESAFYHF